jgi:SAM-dependent methyltransferase
MAKGPEPTLTDQVTRLYDLIAGYHATHLIEIARQLGVWTALTAAPGLTSEALANQLATNAFYTDVLCRTAFAFGLLDRAGAGWRMAPHFDQILGDPDATFYLAPATGFHLRCGEDYAQYVQHFRAGTTRPYQEHDAAFMRDVAESLRSLPRIFIDFVLPNLPELRARLEAGARVLDVGCGGGSALVEIARRFPNSRCLGIDVEPYSIEMAQRLIEAQGLADRCEARLGGVEQLGADASFDIATSFLVVHELRPDLKASVFTAIARALVPGGAFLIFDEVYPENDADLRQMPRLFGALAQWFELIWGNRVNTRSELHRLCRDAGLQIGEETSFSRFHILVATKPER